MSSGYRNEVGEGGCAHSFFEFWGYPGIVA